MLQVWWGWALKDGTHRLDRYSSFLEVSYFMAQTLKAYLMLSCISPVISLFLRSLVPLKEYLYVLSLLGCCSWNSSQSLQKHVCVQTCTHTHRYHVVDMKTHNLDLPTRKDWYETGLAQISPFQPASSNDWLRTGIKLAILVQREQLWEAICIAQEPSWPRQSWASTAVQCPLQLNPSPSTYFDP